MDDDTILGVLDTMISHGYLTVTDTGVRRYVITDKGRAMLNADESQDIERDDHSMAWTDAEMDRAARLARMH